MAALRAHEIKLRLSDAELEIVHARAGDVPIAVWLRQLGTDASVPMPKHRQRRERPLHPQAIELTRVIALAGNHLRRLGEVLAEHGVSQSDIRLALTQIDGRLRQALECV
jgi:hypothetical protein